MAKFETDYTLHTMIYEAPSVQYPYLVTQPLGQSEFDIKARNHTV